MIYCNSKLMICKLIRWANVLCPLAEVQVSLFETDCPARGYRHAAIIWQALKWCPLSSPKHPRHFYHSASANNSLKSEEGCVHLCRNTFIACSPLDVCVFLFFFLFFSMRAGGDRLLQVVDCAAAMDSQGSSSVTPLQTVNMLMHTFPRFRHSHKFLSVSFAGKHTNFPPYSHKHNYRQISSLFAFIVHILHAETNGAGAQHGSLFRGKDPHFFLTFFSLAGCGQRIAPLPRNIRYELQAAVASPTRWKTAHRI